MIFYQYLYQILTLKSDFIVYKNLFSKAVILSKKMNLSNIRNKYKQILETNIVTQQQNEQYNSQRQWINISKSLKQNQNQKQILGQSNSNYNSQNHKSVSKQKKQSKSYENNILQVKQKLAQTLQSLKQKQSQIGSLQQTISQKNELIEQLNGTIKSQKQQLQKKQSLVFQQQQKYFDLQQIVKQKNKQIRQIACQNQLFSSQINHFRKQIQNLFQQKQRTQQSVQQIHKQKKKTHQLKNKIHNLKDDLKRLQFLLVQNDSKYINIIGALQGKHFLGKPNKQAKQLQYWYPQALINGVQKFLKKQNIAYGNKAFTQNIVKFIHAILDRTEKKSQKKIVYKVTSRVKQIQRRKNQIMNVFDESIREQTKKRSQKNSRLYTSQSHQINNRAKSYQMKGHSICVQQSPFMQCSHIQKRNHTTLLSCQKPYLVQQLQRSLHKQQNNTQRNHNIVHDLIQSFCQGMTKIYQNTDKALIKQKVKQLCVWLKDSFKEIYDTNTCENTISYSKRQSFGHNQTGKWKTLCDL